MGLLTAELTDEKSHPEGHTSHSLDAAAARPGVRTNATTTRSPTTGRRTTSARLAVIRVLASTAIRSQPRLDRAILRARRRSASIPPLSPRVNQLRRDVPFEAHLIDDEA